MKTVSLVVAVTSLFELILYIALFFLEFNSDDEITRRFLVIRFVNILWYGSISLFFFTLFRRQK